VNASDAARAKRSAARVDGDVVMHDVRAPYAIDTRLAIDAKIPDVQRASRCRTNAER